jgi:hypothetical protein
MDGRSTSISVFNKVPLDGYALLTPLSEAIASHVRDGRALHADDSLRVL